MNGKNGSDAKPADRTFRLGVIGELYDSSPGDLTDGQERLSPVTGNVQTRRTSSTTSGVRQSMLGEDDWEDFSEEHDDQYLLPGEPLGTVLETKTPEAKKDEKPYDRQERVEQANSKIYGTPRAKRNGATLVLVREDLNRFYFDEQFEDMDYVALMRYIQMRYNPAETILKRSRSTRSSQRFRYGDEEQ